MGFKSWLKAEGQVPLPLQLKATTLGYKVDGKGWLIDGLPIRGASIGVDVDDAQGKHRVGMGIVGGVVALPLALVALSKKDKRQMWVTITSADGVPNVKPFPIKKQKEVIAFVNEFTMAAVQK